MSGKNNAFNFQIKRTRDGWISSKHKTEKSAKTELKRIKKYSGIQESDFIIELIDENSASEELF